MITQHDALYRAICEYPDEDNARSFFELVTELDIPVFVHAPASSFGEECMSMYRLISSVGRPVDECLSLARMIVRGILEQFPTLKLVAAHAGSGISDVIGRMNYAYELQEEAFFLGPYEPMLIKHPPLHYLKMMYMDTVSYHEPALMCAMPESTWRASIATMFLHWPTAAPPARQEMSYRKIGFFSCDADLPRFSARATKAPSGPWLLK